ncbi:flagellar basal body P-ring formation chaperone FlgA [Desulfocurvus sp. DL9XJH121]
MHGNQKRTITTAKAATAALLAALVLLAAAVSAGAGSVQAEWRLSVGTAAVAQGDRVLLGDIASPVGKLPREHWQRLAAIKLWNAPDKPGVRQTVSRDKLEEMLAYYLGEVGQLCVLSGQLAVQRGGKVVQGPELESLVMDSLTRRVVGMQGEVRLRDFRLPSFIFLDDSKSALEVAVAGDFRPGRLSLHLVENDPAGNAGKRYTGSVFMDQWLSVPCAVKPIASKERLSPALVAFQRKNAAYLRGEPWDGRDFGQRVIRSIGGDEVIYADNLEDVPLISKGAGVSLVFLGRYVQLTTDARALADGRMGERIAVQNISSKREIIAEVLDANTVVVR